MLIYNTFFIPLSKSQSNDRQSNCILFFNICYCLCPAMDFFNPKTTNKNLISNLLSIYEKNSHDCCIDIIIKYHCTRL